MSLRYTRKTHPVVLHCFIRDVFIPLVKEERLGYVVYEDGVFDKIDFWKHLRKLPFSWHARHRAVKYAGKTFGCAADLNITPVSKERSFFVNTLFKHMRAWGIAGWWEVNHAHIDAGGNNAFGRGAVTPGNYAFGRPSFSARGNPIAIDGTWGGNTTRKLQMKLGLKVDGSFGPATTRAVQKWVGVKQDGSFGPATRRALANKVGTKDLPMPGRNTWGNSVLQMHLMLNPK